MSAYNSYFPGRNIPISLALRGHLQTILPYLFRKVALPEAERFEVPLRDGDFVDADYRPGNGRGLAILSHGLEGNSDAVYIRSLTRRFLEKGWDVLAWNFRACSGRLNRLQRLYHSGAIDDLQDVISFAHARFRPERIQLAGFSLGGNLTLLCLGKMGDWLASKGVERALAVSAPINLAASSQKLEKWWNTPYRINFLRDLKSKIRLKAKQFPGYYRLAEMDKATTIFTFDDVCTAPIHGFKGAADYYRNCSSIYHIKGVAIPTMVVLAKNDPMLARGNYIGIEFLNPMVQFQILDEGGHCGFWGSNVY
jgi:predicted alpha/beta-fold hydrolase